MKLLTEEDIKKALENHRHWLNRDVDGWDSMRADFSNCDLSNIDLTYADLSGANLTNAKLHQARLRGANLSGVSFRLADLDSADLDGADLRRADFCGAELEFASLRNARLIYAILSGASLFYADLSGATLKGADLRIAVLRNAVLKGADLRDADLLGADLYRADLSEARFEYIPMVCPDEGDFVGWKIVGGSVVKLRIPQDAKRTSSTGRICRCDRAEVLGIYCLDGTVAEETTVSSCRDDGLVYEVGKTVEAKDFDDNRWNACSKGIHFFMNRKEAIDRW